uniref:Uncharacterized protein n=1 Tax=Panagrolaimus davidi TaxID=227884 RepID=A0A914QTX7_9BILA
MFVFLRDYFVSYEHCGEDPSEFKCLIDNFQFIDAKTVGALMAVDMKNEGYRVFLIPYGQKHANFCNEVKSVKPTFFEFSYICVISIWSFHSKFIPVFCATKNA